jgi:hypothetical protein
MTRSHPGVPITNPKALAQQKRDAAAVAAEYKKSPEFKAGTYKQQGQKYDAMVAAVEYLRSQAKTPAGFGGGSNKKVEFNNLQYLATHSIYTGRTAVTVPSNTASGTMPNPDWKQAKFYASPLKPTFAPDGVSGGIPDYSKPHIIWNTDNLLDALVAFSAKAKDAWTSYHKLVGFSKDTGTGGAGGARTDGTTVTKGNYFNSPVLYNVSGVKSSYYRARPGEETNTVGPQPDAVERNAISRGLLDSSLFPTATLGLNSPTAINDARQLWGQSVGSKGMLQTYFNPLGINGDYGSTSNFPANAMNKKYGFQFLYNPTVVNLEYMGIQRTDIALQMAGGDKTNYVPSSGEVGGMSFDIVINRMEDMKFYDANGRLTEEAKALGPFGPYTNRLPYDDARGKDLGLFDEQSAIYNKGTMYDMEYLLRTLMGFTINSELRNEETADMGLFSRRQVELHLGPKLRYRGFVNGLSVRHVLFNERMVPIFTTVSVTFNRYPDYPFKAAGSSKSSNKK